MLERSDYTVPIRFLAEDVVFLEKNGYMIYHLNGLSITGLRDWGQEFKIARNCGLEFENITSHPTDVAVLEGEFLADSGSKCLRDQLALTKDLSVKIRARTSRVTVRMAEVNQYAELAFLHFQRTDKILFPEEGLLYTRTNTTMPGNRVVSIGMDKEGSLEVRNSVIWALHPNCVVVPIVMPRVA